MKVGILSDSHDHMEALEKAAARFEEEKVELVLHAGDHTSPFSLEPLSRLSCRIFGVKGNNDGEILGLSKKYGDLGELSPVPRLIRHRGMKIALMHEPFALEELAQSDIDLIVYGHNHQAEVRLAGETLIVNPGECCGVLTGRSTVAIADLSVQKAEIITL